MRTRAVSILMCVIALGTMAACSFHKLSVDEGYLGNKALFPGTSNDVPAILPGLPGSTPSLPASWTPLAP